MYVLACGDGSLYTGSTTDLARRLEAHRRGKGAKYTRGRGPLQLIAWWHPDSLAAAKSQEARFKGLTRARKLAALLEGQAYGCAVYGSGRVIGTIARRRRRSRA